MTISTLDNAQQSQNGNATLLIPGGSTGAPLPLVGIVGGGEPTSMSIQPPEVEAAEPSKNTELQWKFAEETHQYVREYIRLADKKAAFYFAGSTAIIAFLYNAGLTKIWLKNPAQWVFIDMLSFGATIGLSFSALSCLVTVFPRLKKSKRGHIFFGAIAEIESREEYANDIMRKSSGELIEEKLCHVHDLAKICERKYSVLKFGQWSGAIGVFAMVALLLLAP